jgi:hypothetical protein
MFKRVVRKNIFAKKHYLDIFKQLLLFSIRLRPIFHM